MNLEKFRNYELWTDSPSLVFLGILGYFWYFEGISMFPPLATHREGYATRTVILVIAIGCFGPQGLLKQRNTATITYST